MLKAANLEIATATADNQELAVSVYRMPEGGYTTWWTCGLSIFEIPEHNLPRLLEMVEGAMGIIEEETQNATG